jgi:cytochrome P450
MATQSDAQQFNPFDPALRSDPHPQYRRLREAGPVHFLEELGLWVVVSYDGVRSLLKNPQAEMRFEQFQRQRQGDGVVDEPYFKSVRHFALFLDGEDHRRVRRAFQKHLTPAYVERLRPRLAERAGRLVDRFIDAGEVDLMDGLCRPFPLGTISELLGVPPGAEEQLEKWIEDFEHVIPFHPMDEERLAAGNGAVEGMTVYFTELIARRRKEPGDDLLSGLISEADAGNISDEELITQSWSLYFAGSHTTSIGMGNALVTLFRHPEAMEALRSDPSGIPAAVSELLRYEDPAAGNVRFLPEETEIEGTVIPANSPVVFYIPSANRDEKHFEDPDRLDVCRANADDALSFSSGAHACAGKHLAKATLTIALEQVLGRLPGLRPAVPLEQIEWAASSILHGPASLPVKWDAQGGRQ